MSGVRLSDELANVSATMSQAEAILSMVGEHVGLSSDASGCVYGASTIVRSAIDALSKIEVEQRKLHN